MSMSKSTRLWLTVFLGMMTAMAPLSTDMYLPSLPVMQADFGISASLVQMTLTMTMLGMALGQIFAGPVSDYYGRKKPLVIGMAAFTAATIGCVLAENIMAFLCFRFVMGFAGASGIVVSKAIARDVCEGPELTRFFAMLMMVNGLAPIIAPVIGGQILLFTTWRGVFVTLVAIGFVLLLATLAYKETLSPEKRLAGIRASFAKFPQLLKNRYFLGHCLLQCFVFGGIGVGLMVAGALPARLAGRVPDEKMLQTAMLISFFGSVLLFVGFWFEVGLAVILPILFFTITPLSVLGASSFSLALSRQGKNAGTASALLGFSSMILGGCMMPLVGIAGEHTAIPMCVMMIAGYGLGYIIYLLMIAPEHRKD